MKWYVRAWQTCAGTTGYCWMNTRYNWNYCGSVCCLMLWHPSRVLSPVVVLDDWLLLKTYGRGEDDGIVGINRIFKPEVAR